ncbi:hypothetical protein AVEN_214841-1 [Araneus ventricosus]|uniref:Uncharacterized protein n=1 Tax=Araneus ventricosus TaxID=182803 RepID=A0A4Y2B3X9_ARAVE|nr:hypothetical protein AVEN_239120-1 [Araneus ventricosus]GBL87042.1 hypothetical protein AVEN_214841-1 [Araneus ventricosus]
MHTYFIKVIGNTYKTELKAEKSSVQSTQTKCCTLNDEKSAENKIVCGRGYLWQRVEEAQLGVSPGSTGGWREHLPGPGGFPVPSCSNNE